MKSKQADGQLHTLGLLEELRNECKRLWGASSKAYFRVDELLRELANPNLHDIPRKCRFVWKCGTRRTSTSGGLSPLPQALRWRTRRSMCRDRQLPRSALHAAQRDIGHPPASADAWKIALNALNDPPRLRRI
jgi:hypothetical protein